MRVLFLVSGAMALAFGSLAAAQAPAASDEQRRQEASAEDAAAVQRHVDAYRSGDINRFLATFTSDATVTVNGVTFAGRAELKKAYALNFRPGSPKIEIIESGMSGPNIYITSLFRRSDGSEICCAYEEYTVHDGKIAKIVGSI